MSLLSYDASLMTQEPDEGHPLVFPFRRPFAWLYCAQAPQRFGAKTFFARMPKPGGVGDVEFDMHRSAAPDKHQRRHTAHRDGANVTHEEQDETSRHPEKQGTGHDERGHYGSAANSHTPDHIRPKR